MDEELKAKIIAAAEKVAAEECKRIYDNYVALVKRGIDYYVVEGKLTLPDAEDFHGWLYEWDGTNDLSETHKEDQ